MPTRAQVHHLTATIDNVEPRRDENGDILDAHDGALEEFDGRFYLYGTHYGKTDGLGDGNYYVCYSSPDLTHWRKEGVLLKDAPPRVYYRPYVKFNRRTGKYVLWFNADNKYGVGISDRPEGPFVIQNPNVRLRNSEKGVGDFGLFVDEDGTGYITYTALSLSKMEASPKAAPQHHQISVERLTEDYLGTTGENSGMVAGNVESPSVFKRKGIYYLLFDNTCAFCKNGSGARVYRSDAPLGSYHLSNNINVVGDPIKGTAGWTLPGTGRSNTIVKAQQTHVAQIETATGTVYLWIGDRWGSTADGIKGHDLQIWVPLEFNDDGKIRPLKPLSKWTVDLVTLLGRDLHDINRAACSFISRKFMEQPEQLSTLPS